jgi:hypothetical protein
MYQFYVWWAVTENISEVWSELHLKYTGLIWTKIKFIRHLLVQITSPPPIITFYLHPFNTSGDKMCVQFMHLYEVTELKSTLIRNRSDE